MQGGVGEREALTHGAGSEPVLVIEIDRVEVIAEVAPRAVVGHTVLRVTVDGKGDQPTSRHEIEGERGAASMPVSDDDLPAADAHGG